MSDLVGDYGHLIVDECHHLSAVSFELVARRTKARHVLGLSATVARKDGHHPIIFMQCGQVRYRVDAKAQAATRTFTHKVKLRETGFQTPAGHEATGPQQMTTLYAALAADAKRNDMIFDDVLSCLQAGRRPVILTERRDHLDHLRSRFEKFTRNLVVLYGGMNASERRAAEAGLKTPDGEERLVLATGRYLGVSFSLSASIARSSGYTAGKVATVEQANEGAKLAKEAYEAAKQTQQDECKKRGTRCRAAEDAVTAARTKLATAAPVQSADPGAERLAAVLGIQSSTVQLYAPLLLPLGLELGGFIFLAAGLAPARRRDDEIAVAIEVQEVAKPIPADATEMQEIATSAIEIAKPAATGTRAYYLARLQREFPELATQVASGELSVFRASVQSGLRKEPAKRKWNASDYAKGEAAKV